MDPPKLPRKVPKSTSSGFLLDSIVEFDAIASGTPEKDMQYEDDSEVPYHDQRFLQKTHGELVGINVAVKKDLSESKDTAELEKRKDKIEENLEEASKLREEYEKWMPGNSNKLENENPGCLGWNDYHWHFFQPFYDLHSMVLAKELALGVKFENRVELDDIPWKPVLQDQSKEQTGEQSTNQSGNQSK